MELPEGASLPPLLLIAENSLLQQTGEIQQTFIALPDMGYIFSALQVKEKVFILAETGLYQADLSTGDFDTITTYAETMLSGVLISDSRESILVASVTIAGNPIEQGQMIAYDIERKVLKEVMVRPGFAMLPLALDSDQTLSYISRGGDPSFAFIEQVNLASGETAEIFVESSWGYAVISPQVRYYVAVGMEAPAAPDQPIRYGLRLLDFAQSPENPTWIDLPVNPSQPTGLLWSPDETTIYTYLQNAPNDTFAEAYGLWRMDVETRQMEQIADLDAAWLHPHSLSPDGAWLILLPETEPLVYLVHLSTGTVVKQPIPQGSRLIGFKK